MGRVDSLFSLDFLKFGDSHLSRFRGHVMALSYDEIIGRRRALRSDSYKSLADVGFDGPWVTPYQISSKHPSGPVLVALHWLDEASINEHRDVLMKFGYLPGIKFNRVIDQVLALRSWTRTDIYVTQAFHLVPSGRSERIAAKWIDESFDQVTRHELVDRRVVALGKNAASACKRHGVSHVPTWHPSRRGCSDVQIAQEIHRALKAVGY